MKQPTLVLMTDRRKDALVDDWLSTVCALLVEEADNTEST